ncbi:cardiolipin synthase [Frigidibacter oleivorans]|uniref:cardiolipin synthase n=1 Tax=Frigidibacter oleivorans TaxID=2487129 RepID=UPI000F8F2385|nr:cardiolipin synthase [Frigidibacter oleivorans]
MILQSLSWWVILHVALQGLTLLRVMAREDRDPATRMAWVMVILAVPFAGVALYFLIGEIKISRRTLDRMTGAIEALPPAPPAPLAQVPDPFRPLFDRAAAANGFAALTGNRIELMPQGEGAIDRLVADIDAAERHVHLLFYIWLDDHAGRRVADAAIRAAGRGVEVRVMVDALGSRAFVASATWAAMQAAGVRARKAFSISFPLLRLAISRIDIRNHRKIVVIDSDVAWCGSRNCADEAFAIKARYAPWVDIMLRLTGPVVWQHQQLFVSDWITHAKEDVSDLLKEAVHPARDAEAAGLAVAIAFGSGPSLNKHAVSDVFQAAIAAARRDLVITTPYYVPNEALHQQICAAAVRGVRVRMILPARNDSRIVGMASRSFYRQLLSAGVELHEYRPGLLHAKTLVVDGIVAVIGSANMDRRSFELNYENGLLAHDAALAGAVGRLQALWLAEAPPVDEAAVRDWSLPRRIANNLMASFAPLI